MASPKKEKKLYTLEEVAKHNKPNDTWLILFNKVVNATPYLAEHPGGMDILVQNSGGDATHKFVQKGHTDYARSIMEQHVIGGLTPEALAELEKTKAKTTTVDASTVYRPEEIRKHNQKNDCWVIIEGKVVNVTYFLKEHPGGQDVLLKYAGKDATGAFIDQGHSPNARKLVDEMCIGVAAAATTGPKPPVAGAKPIPWIDLSVHRTEADCWLAIEGKVYDITSFLPDHPGGAQIVVNASGRDATEEFTNQGHSQNAKNIMKKYYIGDVDKNSEKVQVGYQNNGIKLHQIIFIVVGIAIGYVLFQLLK